ncbi:MAG: hypothetical protein ABIO70_35020 [Pseudomonadota bacterium]
MRPLDTLRRHMELGSTGTLMVQPVEGPPIAVYLMQGEILAAESPADGADILTRLVNAGAVEREQAEVLGERLRHAGQVGDVLFGTVSDDLLMDLYTRRFRENLACFIRSVGEVTFAERETIHVENVQVGHDSWELLAELEEQLVLLGPLLQADRSQRLEIHTSPAPGARRGKILAALPADGTLGGLLDASPFELHETLALVATLLDEGGLVVAPVRSTALRPEGLPELDAEALATEEIRPEERGPEDGEPGGEADAYATFLGLAPGSGDEQPLVVDEPAEDDELTMFRDHDRRRRATDGTFTVSRELLDTVDLSGFAFFEDVAQADDQILEMEDGERLDAASGAVNLCFTSPPLEAGDAARKIDVTNEVLRQICRALDEEHGSGTGQAAVQLLVESCPMEVASLFHRAEPGRDGALDTARIVSNLEQRPEAERRRLLNRALKDLVERGFTTTAERISEAHLEAMLERIAGFQRRLGL